MALHSKPSSFIILVALFVYWLNFGSMQKINGFNFQIQIHLLWIKWNDILLRLYSMLSHFQKGFMYDHKIRINMRKYFHKMSLFQMNYFEQVLQVWFVWYLFISINTIWLVNFFAKMQDLQFRNWLLDPVSKIKVLKFFDK